MSSSTTPSRHKAGNDLFNRPPKKKAQADARAPAAVIKIGEHGRYQIKSGRLSGEYVARAFPKPPAKARGMIAEATADTEDAAIAALHEAIDARETSRIEERRANDRSGVAIPSVDEFIEAIRQVSLSKPQLAMLSALALAEDEGLKEQQMASIAGYKSKATAGKSFAGAGLLIAEFLSIEPSSHDPAPELQGTSLLGYRGDTDATEDPGNWVLHPELRDAVRACM